MSTWWWHRQRPPHFSCFPLLLARLETARSACQFETARPVCVEGERAGKGRGGGARASGQAMLRAPAGEPNPTWILWTESSKNAAAGWRWGGLTSPPHSQGRWTEATHFHSNGFELNCCIQGLCERWRWAQPAAELNGTVEREKKSLNGGGLFGHAAAMTLANAKRFMKTGHAPAAVFLYNIHHIKSMNICMRY